MTHGDDFVLTRPTKKLTGVQQDIDKCFIHQSEDHQLWIAEEHQDAEQEVALEKARSCLSEELFINMIPDTLTYL